jgi:hypothetical protein
MWQRLIEWSRGMQYVKMIIVSALMLLVFSASGEAKEATRHINKEFKQNGLWGAVNKYGKVILEAKFDDIFIYSDGTIKTTNGSATSYYDNSGRELLNFDPNKPTVFDQDGFAEYRLGGKAGLLDRSGEWKIKPIFGYVHRFGPTMQYVVHYNGGVGVIDISNNRWVIPNNFKYIDKLGDNGLAVADKKGLKGFIDQNGNWVLNPGSFEDISSFNEYGLAVAKENGKCGFINTKFEWVIKPVSEEKYCFLRFDEAGLFKYTVGGKIGLMDQQGTVTVAPQFDKIFPLSRGLYPVQLGKKWGYISAKGDIKIALKFDSATGFDKMGMAAVKLDGKRYIINTDGRLLLGEDFDEIGYFGENDWTEAKLNGKWGAVDRKGRWVIKPTYECLGFCIGDRPPPVVRTSAPLYFRPDVQ